MIERVQLQEFKSHRDTEIPLGRLTVLVGPNGAGKTSVLQALQVVSRLGSEPWSRVLGDEQAWSVLRRRGATRDTSITVTRMDGVEAGVGADAAPDNADERTSVTVTVFPAPRSVANERMIGGKRLQMGTIEAMGRIVRHTGTTADFDSYLRPKEPELGTAEVPVVIRQVIPQTFELRPDPRALAAPTVTDSVSPQLGPDGQGLAEVIADMALATPDRFASLQEAMRAVIPQVERFRLRRSPVRRARARIVRIDDQQVRINEDEELIGTELVFDMVGGASGIPAHAMSDGTLVVLGILAALWSPSRPALALIDGIEHSLHPKAQWDLLAQLRLLLERFPELQIVATTHSPDLVDKLAADEVIVMAADADGVAHARPLTACPRTDLLEVLGSGELWSAMGERWVTGSAPDGARNGGAPDAAHSGGSPDDAQGGHAPDAAHSGAALDGAPSEDQ